MQIHLPLLKDRGDDVQELATIFMDKLSIQLGMPPVPIDSSVRAALASYDWPGNVRELRNLIERTLILGAFPDDFAGPRGDDGQPAAADSLADLERRHILSVLKETGGNREEAARRLGISRKTIDRKCALWNV
jgi:DNA-binding NtrC family response regulator